MVDPISDTARESGNRRVQLGFLVILTVTPPLISLQGDPSTTELVAFAVVGFLLGVVVVWYLGRLAREFSTSSRR